MSKTKKHLWLFTMLLIYVAIAVAGFLIAYIVKHDFFDSNSPTPPVSKEKSVAVPADWKAYTNAQDKLKFSYPSGDNLKASSYGFGVTSLTIQNTKTNILDFQILLLPKSLAKVVGQDFDSYYAMPDNSTKIIKSPLAQDNTTEKFTKLRNRMVNGLTAMDYQSLASDAKAGSQPEIGTFVVVGSNLVLISTGASNKIKLEEILSSFIYPL